MKRTLWVHAVLVLVAIGCEAPVDELKLYDELVVITNYDTDADFSEYAAYAMPTDTIGFATNSNANDTVMIQSEVDFPRPSLAAIEGNLDARGYTRVERTEDADLGINVTLVNDYNVFQQLVYP